MLVKQEKEKNIRQAVKILLINLKWNQRERAIVPFVINTPMWTSFEAIM